MQTDFEMDMTNPVDDPELLKELKALGGSDVPSDMDEEAELRALGGCSDSETSPAKPKPKAGGGAAAKAKSSSAKSQGDKDEDDELRALGCDVPTSPLSTGGGDGAGDPGFTESDVEHTELTEEDMKALESDGEKSPKKKQAAPKQDLKEVLQSRMNDYKAAATAMKEVDRDKARQLALQYAAMKKMSESGEPIDAAKIAPPLSTTSPAQIAPPSVTTEAKVQSSVAAPAPAPKPAPAPVPEPKPAPSVTSTVPATSPAHTSGTHSKAPSQTPDFGADMVRACACV